MTDRHPVEQNGWGLSPNVRRFYRPCGLRFFCSPFHSLAAIRHCLLSWPLSLQACRSRGARRVHRIPSTACTSSLMQPVRTLRRQILSSGCLTLNHQKNWDRRRSMPPGCASSSSTLRAWTERGALVDEVHWSSHCRYRGRPSQGLPTAARSSRGTSDVQRETPKPSQGRGQMHSDRHVRDHPRCKLLCPS